MRHGHPNDQATDAELLTAADSTTAPFAELYRRHAEAVLAYHYRRTGCPQTAADLTAETFAAAFDSRRSFRDTGAPARAWLFTIARRQLNHFIRREKVRDKYRRRLGVDSIALTPDDYERVEQLADLDPLRSDLQNALESLPPAQADAVRLRVAEDLPYPEVAARMGCSEGAARVRVSRGLTQLADLLEATP